MITKLLLATIVAMAPHAAQPQFSHQPKTPSKKYTWYLGEDGRAHKCAGKPHIMGTLVIAKEGYATMRDLHVEVTECVNEIVPVRVQE